MNALSFILALGGIALAAVSVVSMFTLLMVPLVQRFSPVTRAEVAAWLTLAPWVFAVALVGAAAAPAVAYGLGIGPDHCFGHEHHAHVCPWHGTALPGWVVGVGTAAAGAAFLRLFRVVRQLVGVERLGDALAALGPLNHGFHAVPATRAVCHAVGLVRPKVIISQTVIDSLDTSALTAVVAHERAHIDRSDPLWSAMFALAATLAPLTGVWATIWREAAEHAADDAAAAVTDGPTVARALVAVARLRMLPHPGLAFGTTELEYRVLRLLTSRASPRPSRALAGAGLMVGLAVLTVIFEHSALHHIVEEIWEIMLGD